MPKKTYVIRDSDGRYYRSFCDSSFTTAHSQVLVTDTTEIERARKFRSLWWATHRAKYLSINAFGYYYVFEIIKNDPVPLLQIRNKDAIDKIRKRDVETMKEIEGIITKWKEEHGLDGKYL